MAIWDETAADDKANVAFTQNCPGCGGKLVFDPESGFLKCSSCGSDYDPSMFDVLAALDNIEDDDDPGDPDLTLEGSSEFVCNSCGASVITDAATSATFCRFCGNPVVMGTRLTKKFRPELLIPFKVDREGAEKIFKQWADEHKYAPSDFTSASTLKKLTGIYVPFWLVSSKALTQDYFRSTTVKPNGDREYATSKAAAVFTFNHVPFDGSKRINDNLMESVEPFDYSDMVDFEPSYLQGFYAERYDLSAKNTDMAQRITDRFNTYARNAMSDITGASFSSMETEVFRIKLGDVSAKYALLPVWFLKYDYEGKSYSFAINGQNGKAGGSAPASKFKIFIDLLFGQSALTVAALPVFVFFTVLTVMMARIEAVSEIAFIPALCAAALLIYLIARVYNSVTGIDSVALNERVTMTGYDSYLSPDYKSTLKIARNVLNTESAAEAVKRKVSNITDKLITYADDMDD